MKILIRTMPFIESVICRHDVKVHPSGQSRVKQKHSILQGVRVKVIVIRVILFDLVFVLVRA